MMPTMMLREPNPTPTTHKTYQVTLTKILINTFMCEPSWNRVTTINAIITLPVYHIRSPHLRPIPKQTFQYPIGPEANSIGTKATTTYNQHVNPITMIGEQRARYTPSLPSTTGPSERMKSIDCTSFSRKKKSTQDCRKRPMKKVLA